MKTIKETLYNIEQNKENLKKYMDGVETFTIPGLERLAYDAFIYTRAEFLLEYADALKFLNEDYTRPEIVHQLQYVA